jgi:Na+-driven multidrug efflux pump
MWVGKNIGLENIAEAQEYIKVSNKLFICLMMASTLGFTLFAKQIVHIFTDNA